MRDAIGVAILGVMRMDADRGIDIGVAFGDGDGLAVAFDRADRADRDYRAQPAARARSRIASVSSRSLRVGEMAMGIGQVKWVSYDDFLTRVTSLSGRGSFSRRGNRAVGGFTLWPGLKPSP